jgi:hypothetical protein
MARKLNTFVTVHRRDDDGQLTGESRTVGPDDDLSKPENAWVEKAISNPGVWADGEDDEPATARPEPVRRAPGKLANPAK